MNDKESINLILRVYQNRRSIPREIGLWLLGLQSIFVFLNPDPYLGVADYYIFYIAFIGFTFISLTNFTVEKEGKIVIFLAVFLLLEVGVAAAQGVFSSGYFLSYSLYLFTLFQMLNWDYSEEETDKILAFYIGAAVVTTAILFVQRYDFYGGGDQRHTIKILSHEAIDPNFIAAYLVVPAVIAYSKMLNRFRVVYLIAFLVILAGILYTSSRGAAIGFVLGAGIVTLGFFKGRKKIRKIVILLMALIIGFFVALEYLPQASLSRIVDVASYQDGSNAKRLVDWRYGMEAFLQNPILGYGVQGEMSIIKRVIGVNYISHNTYIALLLQFGVVGFCIFLFCLVELYKNIRHNTLAKAILASTFFVSLLVSAEVAVFFWMPIMLVVMMSVQERKKSLEILLNRRIMRQI